MYCILNQKVIMKTPSLTPVRLLAVLGCSLLTLGLSSCGSIAKESPAYQRAYRNAEVRDKQSIATPLSELNSFMELSAGVHSAFAPSVKVSPEITGRWLWRVPQLGHMGPEVTYRGMRGADAKTSDQILHIGLASGGYDGEVGGHTTLGLLTSIGYMRTMSSRLVSDKATKEALNGGYLRLGFRSLWRINQSRTALGLEAGLTGYYLGGKSELPAASFTPGFGWYPSLSIVYTFGSL